MVYSRGVCDCNEVESFVIECVDYVRFRSRVFLSYTPVFASGPAEKYIYKYYLALRIREQPRQTRCRKSARSYVYRKQPLASENVECSSVESRGVLSYNPVFEAVRAWTSVYQYGLAAGRREDAFQSRLKKQNAEHHFAQPPATCV